MAGHVGVRALLAESLSFVLEDRGGYALEEVLPLAKGKGLYKALWRGVKCTCRSSRAKGECGCRQALLVPSHWGNVLSIRERGTVVPLLTSAASAPWRPPTAGAGNASHSVFPKAMKSGGCSPPPMWEMLHGARVREGGGLGQIRPVQRT